MAIALFIFFMLVLWHIVYDLLILPNVRLTQRYKLFKLRDDLRNLKAQEESHVSDEVFLYVDEMISATIRMMPLYSIVTLIEVMINFSKDPENEKEYQANMMLLENCRVVKVKEIYIGCCKIGYEAFLLNSGGWFAYIIPIIAVAFLSRKIAELMKKIVVMPEASVNQLIHNAPAV